MSFGPFPNAPFLPGPIKYGTLANRPGAAVDGSLYYGTDTTALYQMQGGAWFTLPLGGGAGVSSFNTRNGAVVLSKADVTGTGLAAADVAAYPNTTTLDAITAPANPVALNAKKITGLANGTVATDAAAFGQIAAAIAAALGTLSNTMGVAYRAAALNTGGAGQAKIPLDTVLFDPGGNFDVVTNHRYNVPSTGTYLIAAQVETTNSAAGDNLVAIVTKNVGATVLVSGTQGISHTAQDISSIAVGLASLTSGDFVELDQFIPTSQPLRLGTGQYNYLAVARLG